MQNVLILYYYRSHPARTTILDHLYSFEQYAPVRSVYLNLGARPIPRWVKAFPWDAVIFHTTYVMLRAWHPSEFAVQNTRLGWLRACDTVKIAIPQDEFLNTDLLCDWINEFGIDHVFSVMPPAEWSTIYHKVDLARTQFHLVLTGYLADHTLAKIDRLAARTPAREIDIGYRAWKAEAWLGRHGMLKTRLAELFERRGPAAGLRTDISLRAEDTLIGDAWFEFLLRCKYTLGVEGGASILDKDSSVRGRVNRYLEDHPAASFEEIETNCFPGRDGAVNLVAISPRHLEACATRTCQVLIEGSYNGLLEADRHYISLRRDFGNLDAVLSLLSEDSRRESITQRAYQDLVASGRVSYRSFVRTVLDAALPTEPVPAIRATRLGKIRHATARRVDHASWRLIPMINLYYRAKRRLRRLLATVFSERTVAGALRRVRAYRAGGV